MAQGEAVAGIPERRQAHALPFMSSMNLEKSHKLSEAHGALARASSLKELQSQLLQRFENVIDLVINAKKKKAFLLIRNQ